MFQPSATLITDHSLSVKTTGSSLLNTGLNIPRHPPTILKVTEEQKLPLNIAESMLKKADDLHNAMLIYRKTPPQGHTYSPSQCMFLRRNRTTLPTTDQLLTLTMLNFRIVEEEITKKRHDSKTYYDKSASVEQGPLRPLIIGTYAYTKPPPHQRGKPWIYGKVINHENPRSTLQTSHKFFYLSAPTKSH